MREPTTGERATRPAKIKVKLADGKERAIQHMMITTYWHSDGTPCPLGEPAEVGKVFAGFQRYLYDASPRSATESSPGGATA